MTHICNFGPGKVELNQNEVLGCVGLARKSRDKDSDLWSLSGEVLLGVVGLSQAVYGKV